MRVLAGVVAEELEVVEPEALVGHQEQLCHWLQGAAVEACWALPAWF